MLANIKSALRKVPTANSKRLLKKEKPDVIVANGWKEFIEPGKSSDDFPGIFYVREPTGMPFVARGIPVGSKFSCMEVGAGV